MAGARPAVGRSAAKVRARARWPRLQRDRHGRGLRGPLLRPSLPGARNRREAFADLVADAADGLRSRWPRELAAMRFAVDEVPPAPLPADAVGAGDERVPLGLALPGVAGRPATVVVFRRPVEARAADLEDLRDLVADVVVEQVAALLGRGPEELDPGYDG